jgi:hypothetical protein
MVVAKWFPQFIPNKVLAKDPINEVQRVTWTADNWSWHWNDKNSGCYRLALTKNGWKLWQSIVVRNGTVYGASAKDWSIEATELHQLKAKFAAYRLAGKELCEE